MSQAEIAAGQEWSGPGGTLLVKSWDSQKGAWSVYDPVYDEAGMVSPTALKNWIATTNATLTEAKEPKR